MIRFATFVGLVLLTVELVAQDDKSELRFYANKIESNFRSIQTFSATCDVVSKQILPMYSQPLPKDQLPKGKHFENVIHQPALLHTRAVVKFDTDFPKKLLSSEYDCIARGFFEPHFEQPKPLTSIYIGRKRKIVLTQGNFYSMDVLKEENFPPGSDLAFTLIKYPREKIDEYGVHISTVTLPREFFRAAGWYLFEILRFDNPGMTVEIVHSGLGSNENSRIRVANTGMEMFITLSAEAGFNPVKLEMAIGDDKTTYTWKYKKIASSFVPVYFMYESWMASKKNAEREYTFRADSIQINHEIDTSTFSEAGFGMKDYDRFTDSVTRQNFEYRGGEKVDVSPIRPVVTSIPEPVAAKRTWLVGLVIAFLITVVVTILVGRQLSPKNN